jgi:hypothetical protein
VSLGGDAELDPDSFGESLPRRQAKEAASPGTANSVGESTSSDVHANAGSFDTGVFKIGEALPNMVTL